jgi:hypothetical protein
MYLLLRCRSAAALTSSRPGPHDAVESDIPQRGVRSPSQSLRRIFHTRRRVSCRCRAQGARNHFPVKLCNVSPLTPAPPPRIPSIFCPFSAMPPAGCSPSERSCPPATAAAAHGRPTAPWSRCGTVSWSAGWPRESLSSSSRIVVASQPLPAPAATLVTPRCSVIVMAPDGRILCNFKPYPSSSGLGVTCVAWSPTSQFLAVGCHNSRLYVLNTLTFKPTWETSHESPTSSAAVIYRCHAVVCCCIAPPRPSPDDREHDTSAANTSRSAAAVPSLIVRSAYETVQEATPAASCKPPAGISSSSGVAALRWSHDGRFIASSVMEDARVLWVWDMTALVCVAQLRNLAAFVDFQWCPRTNQLAAACGSRTVYVWTDDGEWRGDSGTACLWWWLAAAALFHSTNCACD